MFFHPNHQVQSPVFGINRFNLMLCQIHTSISSGGGWNITINWAYNDVDIRGGPSQVQQPILLGGQVRMIQAVTEFHRFKRWVGHDSPPFQKGRVNSPSQNGHKQNCQVMPGPCFFVGHLFFSHAQIHWSSMEIHGLVISGRLPDCGPVRKQSHLAALKKTAVWKTAGTLPKSPYSIT